nr:hypothetical protein [Candidatus Liberibacter asiaticus]
SSSIFWLITKEVAKRSHGFFYILLLILHLKYFVYCLERKKNKKGKMKLIIIIYHKNLLFLFIYEIKENQKLDVKFFYQTTKP